MLWYTVRVGLLLLWQSWFRKPADPSTPFRIPMRAWPWHCDAYRHLNNSAYLRLAEDARWAWTARTPLLRRAFTDGWVFLVGGVSILYRHEIRLMSRFEIVCRLIGADERWLYFAQEFVLPDGKVASRALVRATIRAKKAIVNPQQVAEASGFSIPSAGEEVERLKALSELQLASFSAERAV
jgi:acyl-CoA thioesterase FadM